MQNLAPTSQHILVILQIIKEYETERYGRQHA